MKLGRLSTIFSQNQSKEDPDDLEIELGDQYYPIRVRRSARSRSITVSADTLKREVRLGLPRHVNVREALHFVQSKSEWLAARFDEAMPVTPIVHGTIIPLFGEEYNIVWSTKLPRRPKILGKEIQLGGPEDRVEHRVVGWMKDQARNTYQIDLEHYCRRAESDIPVLSVGDARRRWGSCSGSGSIRLNWRLIMAPEFVRQSVVAHEVAHLKHMNHSSAFYAHLDSIFGDDRKAADLWLKANGSGLYLIGGAKAA